jgi:hypothetical protein
LTKLQRAQLFADHKGICYRCRLPIDATKAWTDEHVRALGLSGSNDLKNRAPVHMHCGEAKTRLEDIPRIAKAKRQQAALVGKDPDQEPSIQSRGFTKKEKLRKDSPFAHLPLPRLARLSAKG